MEYQEYLPEILREIEDFSGLGKGFDPETEFIRGKMRSASEECLAETAGEEGLSRFERMFGLHPEKEEGIEERRIRVMGRFRSLPPFSMGWLREKLQADCGERGFSISQDPDRFWLRVSVETPRKNYAEVLYGTLRQQIPAAVTLQMGILHQTPAAVKAGVLLQVGTRWSWREQENGAV